MFINHDLQAIFELQNCLSDSLSDKKISGMLRVYRLHAMFTLWQQSGMC